ncbi:MAG: spore photoproduct lyase family protein [Fidelibacterota bacterium]
MRRSLNIVAALLPEAEPLIRRFNLTKSDDRSPLPIYTNPSETVRLVVSGVGAESAGEAVSILASRTGSPDRTVWLNVGIAGHRDFPVGTPVLARRITDSITGRSWDLPGSVVLPCRSTSVTTVNEPLETFPNGDVFEMEASGFYAAACQVATPDRIQVLKIISDNHRSSFRKISAARVKDLMERNLHVITRTAHQMARGRTQERLRSLSKQTFYKSLNKDSRDFIQEIELAYALTFQELRQVMEIGIDFQMWGEPTVRQQWRELEQGNGGPETARKELLLKALRERWQTFRDQETVYERTKPAPVISNLAKKKLILRQESNGVYGMCPVASEKTVCCNLRTLDAAQGCGFVCTYCSIQTFYDPAKIAVDSNLAQKLENIHLDPGRRYHIGSGQSSDSLLLGNRGGILEAQFEFARENPNVVLEFKTKSKNTAYLLEADVPPNVFVSWSLNPQVIIDHEELRTASLEQRLTCARRVADRGIRVGFHFHPIILHRGWKDNYTELVHRVINSFSPEEVAFVSLGTLTFIKPAIKSLRQLGIPSKVLQIPMEDAAGKMSYPMAVKEEMFGLVWRVFRPWHGKVFFYLCMEVRELWEKVFGYCYRNNEDFENAMLDALFSKLNLVSHPSSVGFQATSTVAATSPESLPLPS